jgi:hypothetical protein
MRDREYVRCGREVREALVETPQPKEDLPLQIRCRSSGLSHMKQPYIAGCRPSSSPDVNHGRRVPGENNIDFEDWASPARSTIEAITVGYGFRPIIKDSP